MISFQIKPWVAFGLPYLLIELFCIGIPVVRTDGRSLARCTVTWLPNFLRWVDYHISLAMGLAPRVELRCNKWIMIWRGRILKVVFRLPDSWSNWNLEMLVFGEREKPEYPEKNLSEQRREPTQPTYGVDAGIWTRATFGATVTSTGRDVMICAILRMILLNTWLSCSRRRRETGLFGVVARTWVFNFHFNQVCCLLQPEFCRLSFLNCPCFLWVTFKARFPSSVI